MLNYAQTTTGTTIVPLEALPQSTQIDERITEAIAAIPPATEAEDKAIPHYLYVWETGESILMSSPALTPEAAQQLGQDAGMAEAKRLLDQAQQRKGEALNKDEIRKEYAARFNARMKAHDQHQPPQPCLDRWFYGWCQGFAYEIVKAQHAAPAAPVAIVTVPEPTRTTAKFRQALIEVDDPEEFQKGVMCGQVSYVDDDNQPATAQGILQVITHEIENADQETPIDFQVGFLLGRIDALLHARKTYPLAWLH
jgi:hypothetical protein